MSKKTKSRRLGILGAVIVGSSALFISAAMPAGATGGGGPIAASVLGSGSDTTQFMMNAIDSLYLFSPGCSSIPTQGQTAWLDFSCESPDPPNTITTENYTHDQVHEAYFLGSSNGIKQLCSQGQQGVAHIDFARSSRGPNNGDCTGLKFVAYARDGISWEAFNLGKGSGLKGFNNQSGTCAGSGGATQFCLTQSQLNGIFVACTLTNWSQVGGNSAKFAIYTPQAGSGTRSTWDGFVGGDSSHCIPADQQSTHVVPENDNTAIFNNGDQKKAIFPFSFGVWTQRVHGQHKAILGAIDNVPVNANTIADGSFPFGRFLYNVYCTASCASGASEAQAVNYVGEEGWICKVAADHANDPATGVNYQTEIANAITASGFVPVPLGVIGGGDTNQDYCRLFNH
jgi:ABC-type phosphate transport system substrate-binding protein